MLSNIHIAKNYLPHQEPMIMVDTLISHENGITKGEFSILKDNVLLDKNVLSEAGLLENMAQTAAMGMGYEFAAENKKPPIGFIGAVKNFIVFGLPMINEKIVTTVILRHQILNASIVEARVESEGKKIASCELKIFLNPEIS